MIKKGIKKFSSNFDLNQLELFVTLVRPTLYNNLVRPTLYSNSALFIEIRLYMRGGGGGRLPPKVFQTQIVKSTISPF